MRVDKLIPLAYEELLKRKFLSNEMMEWNKQYAELSPEEKKSNQSGPFFKEKAENLRLPWYLSKKTRHNSMVLLKSVTKEVAVRAVYFPDHHLCHFNQVYNLNLNGSNNEYTKNIKDVVIFEKFEKVLGWCLDKNIYKRGKSNSNHMSNRLAGLHPNLVFLSYRKNILNPAGKSEEENKV